MTNPNALMVTACTCNLFNELISATMIDHKTPRFNSIMTLFVDDLPYTIVRGKDTATDVARIVERYIDVFGMPDDVSFTAISTRSGKECYCPAYCNY